MHTSQIFFDTFDRQPLGCRALFALAWAMSVGRRVLA